MRHFILLLISAVGLSTQITSAQSDLSGNLTIGDVVPELEINNVLNNGRTAVHLQDLYKKGGMIINFWATWCPPCIEEQQLLDSLLVHRFPELSVLSITYEDSSKVTRFLAKSGMPRSSTMFIATNDTTLNTYFKHRIIPHNIWVDRKGIVRAISGGNEISAENIEEFLQGNVRDIYFKNDDISFDFSKPYHLEDSLIEYRSLIAGYNARITSGAGYNPTEKPYKRFFGRNLPIIDLFWMAYCNQLTNRVNLNLIELRTNDSIKFLYPRTHRSLFDRSRYNNPGDNFADNERRWKEDNLYCYDLILPKNVDRRLLSRYMFEDLRRYFEIEAGIEAEIENRDILCKVVTFDSVRFGKPKRAEENSRSIFGFRDSMLVIQNRTIERLLSDLIAHKNGSKTKVREQPYIDKTGIDYPIDLKIHVGNQGKASTIQAIWDALKKAGFVYEIERTNYPILVLTDRTSSRTQPLN